MQYWILGARDPEMVEIGRILRDTPGQKVVYALGPHGKRVSPAEAYSASGLAEPLETGYPVYAVECGGPAVPHGAVVIDHHRPGDPGYGRPPWEYMAASSIGQVLAHLVANRSIDDVWASVRGWYSVRRSWRRAGWHHHALAFEEGVWLAPPRDILHIAAADHCLAAAYRGECPGVDPDNLMRWRVRSRAEYQGRSVEAVMEDIGRARMALCAAPLMELAPGIRVRDLRGRHVPELPEAAAREGLGFVACAPPSPDGRGKVVCHGYEEQVLAFMKYWGPAQGLRGIYGDPARGFAGGYLY
jgi:hypothetical protein